MYNVVHSHPTHTPLLYSRTQGSKATVTPFWYAAMVFFRYRTLRNYLYIGFLGPRVLPTLLFSALISLLYQVCGLLHDDYTCMMFGCVAGHVHICTTYQPHQP